MLITKTLSDRLETLAASTSLAKEEVLLHLLYEVPERLLESLHELKDTVELPVSQDTEEIVTTMAADLGLTVAGLSVTMVHVIDRVLATERGLQEAEGCVEGS